MSTNYVPAIKAKMGDWTYYITKMKFGEVASQVKLAEQIHQNKELDDAIQRSLSSRVSEMTQFLLNEPQRFYGSLVVAVYKGNPVFRPIKIDEGNKIVDSVDHAFGLLQMDGSQTFFALDGQHRLSSIIEACNANPDLKSEEISVLVIKHDESLQGLVRTRRLFTKLNRYAKATDMKTNIAIDEDDCVAVTTRRLIREFVPLSGYIKIDAAGKQIGNGKADEKYLTTLTTLYEFNKELAESYKYNGVLVDLSKEFLAKRPDDDFLDELYEYTVDVWTALISKIPHLDAISKGITAAGKLRVGAASIWVKPVTQLIVARVIRNGTIQGLAITDIVARLSKLPTQMDTEPWVDVIYDKNLGTIKSGKNHSEFLTHLCSHALGISTSSTKATTKERYGEYFGKKSKDIPNYQL